MIIFNLCELVTTRYYLQALFYCDNIIYAWSAKMFTGPEL